MKKSRFTEEQMVRILRETDRESVVQVAKRHGVSDQTIYAWRKKYGGGDVNDVRQLKQLEQENARLKKLLAERDLEVEIMKEIQEKKMVSARVRRQQATYAMRRGLSQRRACRLVSVARSALAYRSRLEAKDAPVLEVMKRLAPSRPRFGYRRIRVLMDREGHPMSFDRTYRLWRKAAPQVPKKRPRRRLASQPRPRPATRANDLWAIDFVFDRCANGQVLKCLTVVDEFTHACLSINVAGRLRHGSSRSITPAEGALPIEARQTSDPTTSSSPKACDRSREAKTGDAPEETHFHLRPSYSHNRGRSPTFGYTNLLISRSTYMRERRVNA